MERQRKEQAKEPAAGQTGGKGVGEPPFGKELETAYGEFFEGWTNFYRDMGNRLTDNFARQQKAYDEAFAKWNEFAGITGKVMSAASTEAALREANDVWRNYANKLGSRMAKAGTDGLRGYGEVSAAFEKYGTSIARIGTVGGAERMDVVDAERTYQAWLDVVRTFRLQVDRVAHMTREELEDLMRTWMDFVNKMEVLSSEWVGKGGPYDEFVDAWAKQSKELGESLAGLLRGHDHDYEELRKAWVEHFITMEGHMVELARAIGVSYENLYRRFLQEGVTPLSDSPLSMRWWTRASAETLRELTRRVEDLEKDKQEAD